MKIDFLEIAQIELDDAIEYYNYEAPIDCGATYPLFTRQTSALLKKK